MLKTFTQILKHPCSMWLLIAVGCFACVGCQTIGPEGNIGAQSQDQSDQCKIV